MPEDLSPEDQLCLLLARGRFSPAIAKRAVDRLEAGPNWDLVLQRLQAHGLIPLFYHRLQTLDFPGVPQPVREQLRRTFRNNAIWNVLLTQELVRLLTRLGAAGVPVIPLKGIALAESLYGDSALRTCIDLDILIHPRYAAESLRVLHASGYAHRCGTPAFFHRLVRHGKDCELRREDAHMVYPLEVHFGLIWGGPVERRLVADIWSNAVPRPFHGAPACALCPEWEFLHLAEHAARHRLSPLKWIVDLDWLLVRGALDWKNAHEKARRMGWERIVQFSLAACAVLFETPVPEPFAGMPRPSALRILGSGPGSLEFPREALFNLLLLPTLRQKLQFIAVRLFVPSPEDCELLPLPCALFFLYYFMRPWRLAGTLAKWLIQAGVARLRRLRTSKRSNVNSRG